MKHNLQIWSCLILLFLHCPVAQSEVLRIENELHVSISNPDTWTVNELAGYIGQTVIFDVPMVVCNNYGSLTIAPKRVMAPTNQAIPGSDAYKSIVALNSSNTMTLSGVGGYHRDGEKIHNLTAKVNSKTQLDFISGTFLGNTRADLAGGPDLSIIDPNNERNVLVCAMNLEYYLAYQFDPTSGMGPRDWESHKKQRTKTIAALSTINADIYGLVEIQQGDSALKEIVRLLNNQLPHRTYRYVASGTSASGSFTQSAYIYDSRRIETKGTRIDIQAEVANRKKMQIFREIESGETFIYSLNHFKAKSGSGSGLNADQGDGQGSFNYRRVKEAEAVLSQYRTLAIQAKDSDMLIMGDLNAYGKEDPIMTFVEKGFMTDLHTYFHADSSYSYTFHGQAGYLDHALVSTTLLPQVTGMMAYHINSDEDDRYTYDGSWSDNTMFRSSDHDPVIVGLKLDKSTRMGLDVIINTIEIINNNEDIIIKNAQRLESPAYYALITPTGTIVQSGTIDSNAEIVPRPTLSGVYILMIYANGTTYQKKVIVK